MGNYELKVMRLIDNPTAFNAWQDMSAEYVEWLSWWSQCQLLILLQQEATRGSMWDLSSWLRPFAGIASPPVRDSHGEADRWYG